MASINEALENHKLYRLLKRISEGDEQAVEYAGHNGARRPRKWCSQTA